MFVVFFDLGGTIAAVRILGSVRAACQFLHPVRADGIYRLLIPVRLPISIEVSSNFVPLAGMAIGRVGYEPGWKWSDHVAKALGKKELRCGTGAHGTSCGSHGRRTGRSKPAPVHLFRIAPGHDSWVIGDEPYVSLHSVGPNRYAASLQGEKARAELVGGHHLALTAANLREIRPYLGNVASIVIPRRIV